MRNKRALARFKHATSYLVISLWRAAARESARVGRVTARLRRRMDQRGLRAGFLEYADAVAERCRRRALVAAALFAWVQNGLLRAFRKLEERAADKRLERDIVRDARRLGLLHLMAGGFRALADHRAQALRMRRVLARARLRPCARCIEAWFNPLPPPRTRWTRRVPHPVLIGHAVCLVQVHFVSQAAEAALPARARRSVRSIRKGPPLRNASGEETVSLKMS